MVLPKKFGGLGIKDFEASGLLLGLSVIKGCISYEQEIALCSLLESEQDTSRGGSSSLLKLPHRRTQLCGEQY